jgi:hypothetical protein
MQIISILGWRLLVSPSDYPSRDGITTSSRRRVYRQAKDRELASDSTTKLLLDLYSTVILGASPTGSMGSLERERERKGKKEKVLK